MGAYSFNQFINSGVNVDDYKFIEKEGSYKAILDYKRWGKSRNVIAYFTLENGSKIMSSAFQNGGYLGIPDIPEGTLLTLTFEKTKKGICYLRKVEKE